MASVEVLGGSRGTALVGHASGGEGGRVMLGAIKAGPVLGADVEQVVVVLASSKLGVLVMSSWLLPDGLGKLNRDSRSLDRVRSHWQWL